MAKTSNILEPEKARVGGESITASARARTKKTSVLERSKTRTGRALLTPAMVALLLTIIGPLGLAFVFSFTRYDLIGVPEFVGLDNYRSLLGDSAFRQAVGNTLYFAVGQVTVGIVVAFFIAALFNREMVGGSLIRTTIYLPQAMSYVIVALIWSFLYDPIYGPLNAALRGLGFDTVHFLTSTELAMPAIIFLSLWRNLGYFMIILLAGMQAIPEELIEAAHLDGAGSLKRMWHVVVPQMRNTLFFVAITWFTGGLQMFTQSYVMTQGGPVQTTKTVVYHMYESAFLSLRIGEASAVAVLMFLFVVAIGVPVRIWSERRARRERGKA